MTGTPCQWQIGELFQATRSPEPHRSSHVCLRIVDIADNGIQSLVERRIMRVVGRVDPEDRETRRQLPKQLVVIKRLRLRVGRIEQKPPAFSAIHVAGRRAYQLARKGQTVAVPARYVTITAIDVLGYDWPSLYLRIICGRGTYIRSLARDLGRALATGGHVAALRRTGVGDYTLDLAVPLQRCDEPITQQDLLPEPG